MRACSASPVAPFFQPLLLPPCPRPWPRSLIIPARKVGEVLAFREGRSACLASGKVSDGAGRKIKGGSRRNPWCAARLRPCSRGRASIMCFLTTPAAFARTAAEFVSTPQNRRWVHTPTEEISIVRGIRLEACLPPIPRRGWVVRTPSFRLNKPRSQPYQPRTAPFTYGSVTAGSQLQTE